MILCNRHKNWRQNDKILSEKTFKYKIKIIENFGENKHTKKKIKSKKSRKFCKL